MITVCHAMTHHDAPMNNILLQLLSFAPIQSAMFVPWHRYRLSSDQTTSTMVAIDLAERRRSKQATSSPTMICLAVVRQIRLAEWI